MSDKEKKSAYDKLTPQRQRLVDTIIANLENNHSLWRQGLASYGRARIGDHGQTV